jgi:hypothetical protein
MDVHLKKIDAVISTLARCIAKKRFVQSGENSKGFLRKLSSTLFHVIDDCKCILTISQKSNSIWLTLIDEKQRAIADHLVILFQSKPHTPHKHNVKLKMTSTVSSPVYGGLDGRQRRVTITNTPKQSQSSVTLRPKTFAEKQPYIVGYGAAISCISPLASSYQLSKLYNLKPTTPQLLRMSAQVFPQQVLLKAIQMNASTPVKEHLNPWAAFAVVGVLQGAVYGQANVHFSQALQLGKTVSLLGVFRGSGFAAVRDTLSQGVPYMCSDAVRSNVLDPVWKTSSANDDDKISQSIKQWTSVISTSIVATYMSQGFHNCQITMQADQSLGYVQAVKSVVKQHGMKGMIRGAEARVGLLLVVNVLNELLLKPAWAPVPNEA